MELDKLDLSDINWFVESNCEQFQIIKQFLYSLFTETQQVKNSYSEGKKKLTMTILLYTILVSSTE